MADLLIGIHAALGEFAIFAALWIAVEMLNPTPQRLRRAKIASLLLVVFIFASWLAGGWYYVNVYGAQVKPLIKEGPQPWAHGIFTETKEHVFLFLPFLGIFLASLLRVGDARLLKERRLQRAVLVLAAVIFLVGLGMVGMGYIISTGARSALEVGA
ncbi:MAG: hypothetical protein HY520_01490 [Candidatus Aenigmarchaeota archaeon]|nr:hypothetical protein [Candidatus Aenigmarchaeota archaeon]